MADGLGEVLQRSRELGFLGPGEPGEHLDHASSLAGAYERLEGRSRASYCDLGAGGGVPGLVLALRWPTASVVLLEASSRRCRFLREAIRALGLESRATIAEGRAEVLARSQALDARFEAVSARSFGPPAVTAECAVRLLAPSGLLLVTEPPAGDAPTVRWPSECLALLGLGPAVHAGQEPHFVAIRSVGPCPAGFPRRDGVPAKRPLF